MYVRTYVSRYVLPFMCELCTYVRINSHVYVPYARKFLCYIIFTNFVNEAAFVKIKDHGNFAVKRRHYHFY